MIRVLVFLVVIPLGLIAAGPNAEELALLKARSSGAEAKICLKVVDQDGNSVPGARVWRSFRRVASLRSVGRSVAGVLDHDGGFVHEQSLLGRVSRQT
jgi:hypothetical protein